MELCASLDTFLLLLNSIGLELIRYLCALLYSGVTLHTAAAKVLYRRLFRRVSVSDSPGDASIHRMSQPILVPGSYATLGRPSVVLLFG